MDPEQKTNSGRPDPGDGSSQPTADRQTEQSREAAGIGSGPPRGAASDAAGQHSATEKFRRSVAAKTIDQETHSPEEEIWSGGYSPKAMLGTWIALGVVSILAVVGTVLVETIPWMVTAIGLLLIWLIAAVVYAARRLGVHYELTSQRFIHQSGVLTRHTDRIEVIEIDDVSYHQGPIQRMLGIGSIAITSSDRSHPELLMVGIDDVKSVAGLIDDIRRTERRRRSLHIASM